MGLKKLIAVKTTKRRKNKATTNPEKAWSLDIPFVTHSEIPYKMQYAKPPKKKVLADKLCNSCVDVYGKTPVKKVPIEDINPGINEM